MGYGEDYVINLQRLGTKTFSTKTNHLENIKPEL